MVRNDRARRASPGIAISLRGNRAEDAEVEHVATAARGTPGGTR
ncbi:hypothetical protein ABT340_05350 [Streptosporangium sp. NPDC000239]